MSSFGDRERRDDARLVGNGERGGSGDTLTRTGEENEIVKDHSENAKNKPQDSIQSFIGKGKQLRQ